jgi:hypothetical protein
MGLDTYAVYDSLHPNYIQDGDNSIPDTLFPDNNLCGGMFSGSGASFRGKRYNDYVEWVTGVSLYTELITSDIVKDMYISLKNADFRQYRCDNWGITKEETKQLTEWFRVVSEENGSIAGWW